MPAKKRAKKKAKKSSKKKSPYTKASKYVEEEMHAMKTGKTKKKHPIKSRKQAIAIGLSRARSEGIDVPKKPKSKSKKKAS